MTDTPHDKDCIALDEPETIEHLSELDVGDRVLIDERKRPLTVIEVGVRVKGNEKTEKGEIRTPIVRLQGHWAGAKTIELGHRIKTLGIEDNEYEPVLEEMDPIVDFDLGREKHVRRTHIAGSRSRAEQRMATTEVTA